MSIKDKYHGAVLFRIIKFIDAHIQYSYEETSYIIDNSVALYLKYSTKRMSPWNFTFSKEHDELISQLSERYKVYIVLICGDDGICCLNFDEYNLLVDYYLSDANFIKVSRNKRESYAVNGTSNKLNYKINDCNFPEKYFAHTENDVSQ